MYARRWDVDRQCTMRVFTCSCHYCLCATKCIQTLRMQQMWSAATCTTLKLQPLMHSKSLQAILIIVHLKLKPQPWTVQHVKCSTRRNNIFDQCYTNVQDVYTAVSLPQLGRVDHNLVQLIPKYKPLLQRESIVTRTIKEWSADAVQNLKGSLDCTDWDVFVDSASDVN